MNINHNIRVLKDATKWFLKNLKYRLKLRPGRAAQNDVLFFVFEPGVKHPGLADRFKAAVALYNHCKKCGYQFKMYYETPFRLADYMAPKQDWEFKLEDLEYSLQDTKIITEQNLWPLPTLKKGKQYHVYAYAGNSLPRVFEDTGYKWSELFQELFEPSALLQKAFNALQMPPAGTYISVHLRFVNALETFENGFFDNRLKTQAERDLLVKRCHKGLIELQEQNPYTDIFVFSDSKVFLDSLEGLPVRVLSHDSIGHVSEGANEAAQLKSFLDLYAISRSKEVWRFLAPELYNWSCYAMVAAYMEDVPFKEKQV